MKILLVILTLTALQTNCRKHPVISLNHSNGQKIIAVQPLEDYDTALLTTVSKEISTFFKTRVLILDPVNVPQSFYSANKNSPGNDGYFGDSLIQFLSRFINDTIVKIVGITHTNSTPSKSGMFNRIKKGLCFTSLTQFLVSVILMEMHL